MNLEAGRDWKKRVWKSMKDVRVVIIDLTAMSATVKEEIELAYHAVGRERLLFVGNTSKSREKWIDEITKSLPKTVGRESLNLVLWEGTGRKERRHFREIIRNFRQKLPHGTAKVDSRSFRFAEVTATNPTDAVLHDSGFFFHSFVLVPGLTFAVGLIVFFFNPNPNDALANLIPTLTSCFVAFYFFQYIVDCGSAQRRILVCGLMALAGLSFASLRARVANAREAAMWSHSSLNLKRMGLALHNFHANFGSFPPDPDPSESEVDQSWQTYLLPYLDQDVRYGRIDDALYGRIDLEQPWHSVANQEPFQTVIVPFTSPGLEQSHDEQGYALSHYAGNELVFGGQRSLGLRDFRDGSSNTFLAGEVEGEFRPWGDPRNLRHPSVGVKRGPHSFGRYSGPYTILLMCDGVVKNISSKVDPKVFEALGTPNSGDDVTGWDR